MKLTALTAVVLFCVGGLGTAESHAQCLLGRCLPGPSLPFGSSTVSVSVGAPSLSVRQGLFGRTIIRQRRGRANVQVFANSSVPILNTSAFQFIPQQSFLSLGVGGFSGMNYGYGGYGSDDLALAARIRQEAAETAEIKSAVSELLARLNEPVTAGP